MLTLSVGPIDLWVDPPVLLSTLTFICWMTCWHLFLLGLWTWKSAFFLSLPRRYDKYLHHYNFGRRNRDTSFLEVLPTDMWRVESFSPSNDRRIVAIAEIGTYCQIVCNSALNIPLAWWKNGCKLQSERRHRMKITIQWELINECYRSSHRTITCWFWNWNEERRYFPVKIPWFLRAGNFSLSFGERYHWRCRNQF